MKGYKDKFVESNKLQQNLPAGIIDKKGKPFDFKHPLRFDRGDVVCEETIDIEDPVYTGKGYVCVPTVPQHISAIELPRQCRTNTNCPRGYSCRNGECIWTFNNDLILDPIEIEPMWCNYNGWFICGTGDGPVPGCYSNDNQSDCVNDTGYDYYNCLWCEAQEQCHTHTTIYGNAFTGGSWELQELCGGLNYYDSYTYQNELGCTDPYAINYNPYAFAQRNEFGEGCPNDEDCCLYEGTKIKFQRESSTAISLTPGSYIIVFYNNNFIQGGTGGHAAFWDVFQSLAPWKHAPQSQGGKFYITDGQSNSMEEINQIKNGGFDLGSAGNCDPSTIDNEVDACTGNYWYHITVYENMTYLTNYKYRLWQCGESIET